MNYKIKYKDIFRGFGPNEYYIDLLTYDGSTEEISVHKSQLDLYNEYVNVGVINYNPSKGYLVELPVETSSGKWRIYVKEIYE